MAQFTYQGTSYEIPEFDDLSTEELREVKKYTGMGGRSLAEGFLDMDVDAVIAIVYIVKKRAGEKPNWSDFDNLRPFKDIEWPQGDDEEAENVEEQQPDPPTRQAANGSRSTGTTRKAASSST